MGSRKRASSRKILPFAEQYPSPLARESDTSPLMPVGLVDEVDPLEFLQKLKQHCGLAGGAGSGGDGAAAASGRDGVRKDAGGAGAGDAASMSVLYRNVLYLVENLKACRKLLAVSSYIHHADDLDEFEVLEKLMDASYFMLNAERISLYDVNAKTKELVLTHTKDEAIRNMRLSMESGIAGFVARENQVVNVLDAYSDDRFNAEVDSQTGFRTRNVLCAPVLVDGEVAAVVQAINKVDPAGNTTPDDPAMFSPADEGLITYLASQAAMALKNAQLFRSAREQSRKAIHFQHLLAEFTSELELDKAVDNILSAAKEILDADRVSMFLYEEGTNELQCTVSEDVRGVRVAANRGLAGSSFQQKRLLNVEDARADPRFNPEVDSASGFTTVNMLCAPILPAEHSAAQIARIRQEDEATRNATRAIDPGSAAAAAEAINMGGSADGASDGSTSSRAISPSGSSDGGGSGDGENSSGRHGRTGSLSSRLKRPFLRSRGNSRGSTRSSATDLQPVVEERDRSPRWGRKRGSANSSTTPTGTTEGDSPATTPRKIVELEAAPGTGRGAAADDATDEGVDEVTDSSDGKGGDSSDGKRGETRSGSRASSPDMETPLGVLQAINKRSARHFYEEDERAMQALCDQASIAIANARVFHSERVYVQQSETVLQFAMACLRERNLKSLATAVLNQAKLLVHGHHAAIYKYNRGTNSLSPFSLASFSENAATQYIETSDYTALLTNAGAAKQVVVHSYENIQQGVIPTSTARVQHVVVCPVLNVGETFAILILARDDTGEAFTREEAGMLKRFSDIVGTLLPYQVEARQVDLQARMLEAAMKCIDSLVFVLDDKLEYAWSNRPLEDLFSTVSDGSPRAGGGANGGGENAGGDSSGATPAFAKEQSASSAASGGASVQSGSSSKQTSGGSSSSRKKVSGRIDKWLPEGFSSMLRDIKTMIRGRSRAPVRASSVTVYTPLHPNGIVMNYTIVPFALPEEDLPGSRKFSEGSASAGGLSSSGGPGGVGSAPPSTGGSDAGSRGDGGDGGGPPRAPNLTRGGGRARQALSQSIDSETGAGPGGVADTGEPGGNEEGEAPKPQELRSWFAKRGSSKTSWSASMSSFSSFSSSVSSFISTGRQGILVMLDSANSVYQPSWERRLRTDKQPKNLEGVLTAITDMVSSAQSRFELSFEVQQCLGQIGAAVHNTSKSLSGTLDLTTPDLKRSESSRQGPGLKAIKNIASTDADDKKGDGDAGDGTAPSLTITPPRDGNVAEGAQADENADDDASAKKGPMDIQTVTPSPVNSEAARLSDVGGEDMPLLVLDPEESSTLRTRAQSWDFDVLTLTQRELRHLAIFIFQELDFLRMFDIDPAVLKSFVAGVQSNYRHNHFHNFWHAVCVAHMCYMMLRETRARRILEPKYQLGLVVSALCHDLDHPGNTNAFEINAGTELAVLYNDQSVLENHHCALAFQLLRRSESNLFGAFSPDDYKTSRKSIVTSILATDMALHFQLNDQLKQRLVSTETASDNGSSPDSAPPMSPTSPTGRMRPDTGPVDTSENGPGWQADTEQDQQFLAKSLLHAADLSNPTRQHVTSRRWACKIAAEFNDQVEKERELGLPVQGFLQTRTNYDRAKNELNFISLFVEPWWRSIATALPELNHLVVNMENNIATWRAIANGEVEEESAEEPLDEEDRCLKSVRAKRGGEALVDEENSGSCEDDEAGSAEGKDEGSK